jgi:nicotinamidase-related amidase
MISQTTRFITCGMTLAVTTRHLALATLAIASGLLLAPRAVAQTTPSSPNSPVVVSARGTIAARENLTDQNAALVLVDYQDGLMSLIKTLDQTTLRNNAVALMKLGQAFDMPTIVLGDEGGFRGNFMPELRQVVKKNFTFVERHTPSAWREPKFIEAIKKTGRKKLIIAGITTDNCVTLLTLDALREGYDVYIVLDAGGCDSKLAEEAAIARLLQAGAVTVNWVQLASELLVDWQRPQGNTVGQIYAEHIGGANSQWALKSQSGAGAGIVSSPTPKP